MATKFKLLKTFCFSLAHHSQPKIESSKPNAMYVKFIGTNKSNKKTQKSETVDTGTEPV